MPSLAQMLYRLIGVTRFVVAPQRLASSATVGAAANASRNEATRSPLPPPPSPRRHSRYRWKFILGAAVAGGCSIYLANVFLPDPRAERDPTHYYSDWQIRFYTSLPWSAMSKLIGIGAMTTVPVSWRSTLYGLYARTYNCNMEEAQDPRFESYKSFSAFFNRPLREEARPLSACTLISPVDGTVLHVGAIADGRVEYVKGHDYHIDEFLGPIKTRAKKGNELYQMVVYLAPGDYHGFHSPLDWKCAQRIHHPGYLLSVRPHILEWIPFLLCLNERVVLSGSWKHGHFSMTAVAATNVGDIVIDDESLQKIDVKSIITGEEITVTTEPKNYVKGEHVGEFRLGSTVVLIFEGPPSIDFTVAAGDRVQLGQSLILKDY